MTSVTTISSSKAPWSHFLIWKLPLTSFPSWWIPIMCQSVCLREWLWAMLSIFTSQSDLSLKNGFVSHDMSYNVLSTLVFKQTASDQWKDFTIFHEIPGDRFSGMRSYCREYLLISGSNQKPLSNHKQKIPSNGVPAQIHCRQPCTVRKEASLKPVSAHIVIVCIYILSTHTVRTSLLFSS